MKIKKILVSQPEPTDPKSPYFELREKCNLKIDFRQFIHVEHVSAKEFRTQKIDILAHTAVIFTTRTGIDHFFQLCEEMRITVPETMKYFCVSESIAVYLQKYIIYRKRKIFHSTGKFANLVDVLRKHKDETYLVALSDIHNDDIPNLLNKYKFRYTCATIYKTVASDLHDIQITDYDMLVFFSPQGIKSLFTNFPDFQQNDIKVACFGAGAAQAVLDAGLRLDVQAPVPEAPSMTMALDQYIRKYNRTQK